MKKLLIILAILCLAATDTINTVPSNDASFLTDLQDFLKDEDPQRDNERFSGVVVYGGYHTDPGATRTATVSACVGYPDGYYVSQDAVSHTYTANKHTYVFLDADDSTNRAFATCNFADRAGHFIFIECGAASNLITQQYLLPLLYVVTDGSEITSVTDYRGGEVAVEGIMQAADASFTTVLSSASYVGGRTITVNERHPLTNNVTVPANTRVRVRNGGLIQLGAYDLDFTANSDIECTLDQCIDANDAGDVSGLPRAYPDWFGAVRGDNTVDSAIAFRDAFEGLGTNGTLYLSDGIYYMNSHTGTNKCMVPMRDNVSVIGQGESSVISMVAGIVDATNDTSLFYPVTDDTDIGNNTTWKDFTVDWNGDNNVGAANAKCVTIGVHIADNIHIENIHVKDAPGIWVFRLGKTAITDVTQVRVVHNFIDGVAEDISGYAITDHTSIYIIASDVLVSDNQLLMDTDSNYSTGIEPHGENILVHNNQFTEYSKGVIVGGVISGCQDVTISDNQFLSCSLGVHIWMSANTMDNLKIHDNLITYNSKWGKVGGGISNRWHNDTLLTHVDIVGNTVICLDTDNASNFQEPIHISDADDVRIVGNRLIDGYGFGILYANVDASNSRVTIAENTVINMCREDQATYTSAISVQNGAGFTLTDLVVRDNFISASSCVNGIKLTSGAGATINRAEVFGNRINQVTTEEIINTGATVTNFHVHHTAWNESPNGSVEASTGSTWRNLDGTCHEWIKIGDGVATNADWACILSDSSAQTGATPTAASARTITMTNAGATDMTNILGGKDGQEVVVKFGDGNTTVKDGGNLRLSAEADWTPANHDFMVCQKAGLVWYCQCSD